MPFEETDEKLNKVFAMALVHVAPGTDVVNVILPLQEEAREGHIIRGLQNNM